MRDVSRAKISRLLYDPQDYQLLGIVDEVLARGRRAGFKRLLAPYLHPHGIKELAAPSGLRMAYAAAHLLGSLERGKAKDRLEALRSLRDEAIVAPQSGFRRNAARVLVQIMKDLVRAQGDDQARLRLAHDFRMAALGARRFIRAQLAKRHLYEMPEQWNQIAFDDHVHDANTKGRKSPTHLIMDAWIKGIRELTVVYYNYIRPEAAVELLEAAAIMEIKVLPGVELCAVRGGRFVHFVWTPRGLRNARDFMDFLHKPQVAAFMELGREVSRHRRRYVLDVLRAYNERHRLDMAETFGVAPEVIGEEEFLEFVGAGQPSLLHLGRLIRDKVVPHLRERLAAAPPDSEEQRRARELMTEADAEYFLERHLAGRRNPHLRDPGVPGPPGESPELLTLSPRELTERLSRLHFKNWITLNLEDVSVEDVICLLHECRGAITHLEVFNLKGFEEGRLTGLSEILELRGIINSGNAVLLKKYIRGVLDRVKASEGGAAPAEGRACRSRTACLEAVLDDIAIFQGFYRDRELGARMGTDSTGGSRRRHGMGLAVDGSLPFRAGRSLRMRKDVQGALPLYLEALPGVSYASRETAPRILEDAYAVLRGFNILRRAGYERREFWTRGALRAAGPGEGNVHALGGLAPPGGARANKPDASLSWRYMDSRLKNVLKVVAGFIPAALSFALTKDWWLLAWFGPVIWFGITGVRNIIQSVLGCGGLRRSPLLKWNDLVSWSRLCDSLFYTGFSVPLLDYFCKSLLLDQGFGINTATSPVLLYAIMALVNGLYISTHNIVRGLPKKAAAGNFFRSLLSIPLALAFNAAVGWMIGLWGEGMDILAIDAVLQKWAAIISKLASDCVAGVIEGLADRGKFVNLRRLDVKDKLSRLYGVYATLEMLYPKDDVAELLTAPEAFIETIASEKMDLERIVIVNALDFMYFWMRQPRGRTVMRQALKAMSQDERRAFLASQCVLTREREISLLFIDGLVGKNFAPALAFYLDNARRYLDGVQEHACRVERAN